MTPGVVHPTKETLIETVVNLLQTQSVDEINSDPVTVAVLIQSYTMGKIVDDFADQPMDPEKWIFLIDNLLEMLLFKRA